MPRKRSSKPFSIKWKGNYQALEKEFGSSLKYELEQFAKRQGWRLLDYTKTRKLVVGEFCAI